MAVVMASNFSEDGKYFACISTDGKLKIWDTISNSFDQEFTPDFHLTSPCSCLHFIQPNSASNRGASPRKKKRRESETNFYPNIVLGTTSGQLLVYSIAKANLECTISSDTSQSISCLTSNGDTIYSGSDQNIFVWSLQHNKLLDKWKGGNEKITAILIIPDSIKLLTASKNIKLWDVKVKEVLRTFTGHSSEVTFLHYVNPKGNDDAYFITGSKGDRLLNCWNLGDAASNKNTVASFLMEDIVQNISVIVASDGCTKMAATVRSGLVHIYQHTLNGKCNKPLKPKTTIQVVADTGQSKELVTPIRIIGGIYRDEETLRIGHGTEVTLTFENIAISYNKKIHCLIRKDPKSATTKDDPSSKIHTPIVNNNEVHYLTSQTSSVAKTVKRKNDGQTEVPMEKRLENLTLTKLESSSQVPKVDNVAQLLMQGLHSKDKNILRTVLRKQDENIIRNTVKRLPIQLLAPLIQELISYIQGKTLSSQIGSVWLKHILQIHAGILMSNPELPELLGSALGSIESRLLLLTPLNRLRGRLDLLVSQVSSSSGQESVENEEPLLIFNDKDSSDSDEENIQLDNRSESENEWEEESSEEEQMEENNIDSDSEVMSS